MQTSRGNRWENRVVLKRWGPWYEPWLRPCPTPGPRQREAALPTVTRVAEPSKSQRVCLMILVSRTAHDVRSSADARRLARGAAHGQAQMKDNQRWCIVGWYMQGKYAEGGFRLGQHMHQGHASYRSSLLADWATVHHTVTDYLPS